MIGIIGAMDDEVTILKTKIDNLKESQYHSVKFYEGMICGKEVVLMQSGIGKVNAAMSTTILFEQYEIDFVINIGTAGGVKENCNVLDIVISDKVCYHDVDVTAFKYEYGQVPKCPLYFESDEKLIKLSEKILTEEKMSYHKGLIVSGDSFVHEKTQIEKVKNHFSNVIALEMEAAAIAQVCYLYQKQFIVLRSLSDIAGKESHVSFSSYLEQSALNSSTYVLKLIEQL
ncbi:5'-methylthioadenosine/S-adenosylhomocysteine nucleosidase [Mycoplasmatota bacterium]|nr:5'-methylthioadenosine/S-adenosylhomocysteine nucleosidase [Mycoplasmatota bacterium]